MSDGEDSGRQAGGRSPDSPDVGAKATESEEDTYNPRATWLGFLVVLVLLLGTWFVVNAIRCDPLFSDAGLSHSRACR